MTSSPLQLFQIDEPGARPHASLEWPARLELLRAWFAARGAVIVAYSGGVDSSVVLRVAHEVLGDRAIGAIGRSDSYAASELELALAQAARFGARIEIVTTGELTDPSFASNPVDRCYHCKTELYRELAELARRLEIATIADGTILDDLGDWRPGRRAAAEREVCSPLAELGFDKRDVRAVAAHYALASTDKPASPCLASRVPYGTPITRENLAMIERGEALLHAAGFRICRVRHHGDMARIEIDTADLARALGPAMREQLVAGLREIGYRYVTIDLEGFRSGSLNAGITVPRPVGADSGPEPE